MVRQFQSVERTFGGELEAVQKTVTDEEQPWRYNIIRDVLDSIEDDPTVAMSAAFPPQPI